jgi:acyl-CoA thioesterase
MIDPSQIIDTMMSKDFFSQWLGIERLEERAGFCRLRMVVRNEMCNGFGIAHGGISYSLADSALAFASNSRGQHALSIETSISHLHPVSSGDILIATAEEKSLNHKIALYEVSIRKDVLLVALFKGMVFRKDKLWELPSQ